jgi:hypothetical protein
MTRPGRTRALLAWLILCGASASITAAAFVGLWTLAAAALRGLGA